MVKLIPYKAYYAKAKPLRSNLKNDSRYRFRRVSWDARTVDKKLKRGHRMYRKMVTWKERADKLTHAQKNVSLPKWSPVKRTYKHKSAIRPNLNFKKTLPKELLRKINGYIGKLY